MLWRMTQWFRFRSCYKAADTSLVSAMAPDSEVYDSLVTQRFRFSSCYKAPGTSLASGMAPDTDGSDSSV